MCAHPSEFESFFPFSVNYKHVSLSKEFCDHGEYTSAISCRILAPFQATLCFASIVIGFLKTSLSFPYLILLLAVALIYLTKSQKLKSQNAKQLPLPPGPKPWPLVGCLPTMLTNEPTFQWIHNLMKEMKTEIACIRLGNVHVIPVTSPEISREILNAQDAVFASSPLTISTQLITRGYLTAVLVPFGEQWKKMKRVLGTQVLSPEKYKWFYGKRLEKADHLVRYVYHPDYLMWKNKSAKGNYQKK
ncbi:conserved hypothetical protein [Ricinus communis]|uniref:Cytochrome P450 n=1 Tax=Ricinus communis TaxID=3988 RepID=B9SBR5_RICCO|nr:conserved hypothetical protein [Ricinus communis]